MWSAAALGAAAGGMTRDDLVSYYLVLIVVNQITYSQSNWTVGDLIRAGSMNALLLRPVPPVYHTLADEVAGKVVYLTLIVPLTALLGLILRPQVPWTWGSAAAFVPALALAWALRFAWGYALALLAFWATRADALLAVQDTLVFLLAGQVAPLALLPAAMQTRPGRCLFRYMLASRWRCSTALAAGNRAGFSGGGRLVGLFRRRRRVALAAGPAPLRRCGRVMPCTSCVSSGSSSASRSWKRPPTGPISTWPCSIRCWAWPAGCWASPWSMASAPRWAAGTAPAPGGAGRLPWRHQALQSLSSGRPLIPGRLDGDLWTGGWI